MSSLIPGVEYDIFISYRQKDNKGDRWVSEFVEALKTELESTFKDEISVYFDINPHDGLLETHDVDASLKEKLKCLVFIPVLSRTYCDPKSFAWKNEFEAFVEQAFRDQFGLIVKLPNGNIANRVLPVRIHDLDKNDVQLCESITRGVLHDIEFIYRSEGVNRPLRSKEDSPGNNLNKTFYRDQVNKTALAIKEIILGLKGVPDLSVEKSQEQSEQEREFYEVRKPLRSAKNKLLIGAGILAILIIVVLFVWLGPIGRNPLKSLIGKDGKIPVAVMPFQNMTNDTLWDVWQDGIQNILITNLSNSPELKVRQPETVTGILQSKGLTDYASLTPSVASDISRKLETNVNITGSIKKSGGTIRVNAQIVDTKTGEALKSFQIDGTADNILNTIDSLSRMVQDFLLISVMKKELDLDIEFKDEEFTSSPEAFRYWMYGQKAFRIGDMSTAREWYLKAIAIDSNFVIAIFQIHYTYWNQGMYGQAKQWCLKGYKKKDMVSMFKRLEIECVYADCFETPHESLKYIKQLKEHDDRSSYYFWMGIEYFNLEQYDKAIPEFEKNLEITLKLYSEPWWSSDYEWLVWAYYKTGQNKKAKKLLKESEKYFPDDENLTWQKAVISLAEGDTIPANQYIQRFISITKDLSWSEARIAVNLALMYSEAGMADQAEKYYRKSLSLEPERPLMLYYLARFLINNDRSINEALELIDKALELLPDNDALMDTKGWGLYKQGKYQEALEILQNSWDLRMKNSIYDHSSFLHLEAAKKAVAMKN